MDVAAFNGNPAMIDVAAKLMTIGRVEVNAPDNTWFGPNGLTDRGKAALKAFEAAGVVVQFGNPPARLLADLLDNASKGFILTGMTSNPSEPIAKKMTEKKVLFALEFDPSSPDTTAQRLIELKKAFNGSGHLLLTTQERVVTSPMGDVAQTPRQKVVDAAKQKMYLALVKAGWTKEEIYSMTGVTPPQPGQMPGMGAARLGGNLGKIGS